MSGAASIAGKAEWLPNKHLQHLLLVLSEGSEEARIAGGAVRNALLGEPVADIDIATTTLARGDHAARRGGGVQDRADRSRARHDHGDRRRQAVRGDDAARRHRDRRPPRQGAFRPRLAARCRAAGLHHQRALRDRRRRRHRSGRRYRRPRKPNDPLHRRCRHAHPRGFPADPALLPLFRLVWRRPAGRSRSESLRAAEGGARPSVGRARLDRS